MNRSPLRSGTDGFGKPSGTAGRDAKSGGKGTFAGSYMS
jgi:hypothetical protein